MANFSSTDPDERLGRHWQDDYERLGRQLVDVVQTNADTKLTLNAIRLHNAQHTRTSFLNAICQSTLSDTPLTLKQILARTRALADELSRYDAVADVQASLEEGADALSRPGDVDLNLHIKEAGRFFLRTATDVGNGEGSAVRFLS